MKTLILADVHHKWKVAQRIIDHAKCDHVIHLGDHQDDFGDTVGHAVNTAKWTRDRLDAGDTILLGNHDLPYWFPHEKHNWGGCGWEPEKHAAIQRYIGKEDRKKFKLWVECEGWVLSHAGFCSMYADLIPHHDIFIEETLHAGSTHPLICHVGGLRGGKGRGGGVLWMDWRDMIAEPGAPKVAQIVGHTPYPDCQHDTLTTSEGFFTRHNLDTHLRYYGIIEDGELCICERPE